MVLKEFDPSQKAVINAEDFVDPIAEMYLCGYGMFRQCSCSQIPGRELFQFFYAADNLDAEQWDIRSLGNDAKLMEKDRIAMIALELAVRI